MFVYRAIDWVKNSVQYLLGAVLFFTFFGNLDAGILLAGLAGFVISYNSVYYLNDIIDYESDRKDTLKKKLKPIVTGKFTKKEALIYYFASLLIGLPLSFAISRPFGLLVASLLLLNMLHSTIMKKIGTKAVACNLFIIQLVKYSLGWLALTVSLEKFPFFVFASFSAAYITFYLIYKKRLIFYGKYKKKSLKDTISSTLEEVFQNRLFLIPVSLTLLFYVSSIFLYPFKLQLLLLIPILISVSLVSGRINFIDNVTLLKSGWYASSFSILTFILVFFMVQNPVGAEINDSINSSFGEAQQNIADYMPEHLKKGIDKVNQMVDSDRERVESFLLNLTK